MAIFQTVDYMKNLLEVRDAVGDALAALGDGNWLMGDGVRVAGAQKLGVGLEEILLEHYICEDAVCVDYRLR